MVASLNAVRQYKQRINKENEEKDNLTKNASTYKDNDKIVFPKNTMIGVLSKYISTPNEKFQPMNANFGIIPELEEKIKDKKLKYEKLADRAIEELREYITSLYTDLLL